MSKRDCVHMWFNVGQAPARTFCDRRSNGSLKRYENVNAHNAERLTQAVKRAGAKFVGTPWGWYAMF